MLAITAFALALRLVLVWQITRVLNSEQIIHIQWDAPEYVHLGGNLAHHGTYINWGETDPRELKRSHHMGLLRTPGFPAFYAIFEYFGCAPHGVLWGQAVLASVIAPCAMLVAFRLLRSKVAAYVAGGMVALSPTGTGLCGVPIVDCLFGVLVALGFSLFFFAVMDRRRGCFIAAGLVFSVGVLIKPSLLYWPVLLPVLALLIGRLASRPVAWRLVALVMVMQVATVSLWCWRNLHTEGVWMFSSITGQNLYTYLGHQVMLYDKAGHPVLGEDLLQTQYQFRDRELEEMLSGQITPGQIAQRQEKLAAALFKAQPRKTLEIMYANMTDCFQHPWCHLGQQLPGRDWERDGLVAKDPATRPTIAAAAVSPMGHVVEDFFHAVNYYQWEPNGRMVAAGLMVLSMLLPVMGVRYRHQERSGWLAVHAALALPALYFLGMTATSFAQGSRLIYPAEFFAALMVVSGAWQVWGMVERMWGRAAENRLRGLPEAA